MSERGASARNKKFRLIDFMRGADKIRLPFQKDAGHGTIWSVDMTGRTELYDGLSDR